MGRSVTGVSRECTFFFQPGGVKKSNDLIAYNADTLVVDNENTEPLEPVSSLLGLDLLCHFRLCLELDSGVVSLDHPASSDHVIRVKEVPATQSTGPRNRDLHDYWQGLIANAVPSEPRRPDQRQCRTINTPGWPMVSESKLPLAQNRGSKSPRQMPGAFCFRVPQSTGVETENSSCSKSSTGT